MIDLPTNALILCALIAVIALVATCIFSKRF